jgi:hypothetical protein
MECQKTRKCILKFYFEFHFLFASGLGGSILPKKLKIVVTYRTYSRWLLKPSLTSSQLAKAVAACFQDSTPFTFSKNCNEIIIESICHFQLSIPVSCLKYLNIRSTEEKCYVIMSMSFISVNKTATSSSLKKQKTVYCWCRPFVYGKANISWELLVYFSGRYSLWLREWDSALQKRVNSY